MEANTNMRSISLIHVLTSKKFEICLSFILNNIGNEKRAHGGLQLLFCHCLLHIEHFFPTGLLKLILNRNIVIISMLSGVNLSWKNGTQHTTVLTLDKFPKFSVTFFSPQLCG